MQEQTQAEQKAAASLGGACIAIVVEDGVHRRLLESASVHLHLRAELLDPANLPEVSELLKMELIVADLHRAQEALDSIQRDHRPDDPYRPGVIAVVPVGADLAEHGPYERFDGVLPLPQTTAVVSAQLSVALYAHRAFARRYDDALEESRLNRQIFHSVTSGVSVTASEGDQPLSYVNPAFEVMTGYALEEVQGKNCRFLQGEERDQPGLALVREAIHDGKEVVVVLRNFRKDGTPFWNELNLAPIRNREGKVTHFVGIQTDVTARVDYENALRESEKLAVVGRLAASIAHEINNPLESVTNLVYLAEHSASFEESRGYLRQVDQELRRVKLITTQSLRFYKQSTRPQAVQLSELLDSVLHIQRSRIEAAGVQVERRDRLRRSIVCLESEIRQVLNNIISNATDAMKGRGGRLLVRTEEMHRGWGEDGRGQQGVAVTIADTGTGIPPEAMQNLYKAFHTTKGLQGTGLGLWISSEIVQRHGGSLKVRTRSGAEPTGTVFRLFLPFQGAGMQA